MFEEVKNRLGFGCMRMKMNENEVDYTEFKKMIDAFLEAGFNYFDTAHGYIDGKSETSIRDCLVARYNREDFVLANKLSIWLVKGEADVVPFFENQLKLCGVDYFDFYLCHALDRQNYEKYKEYKAFEHIQQFKKQGKVRHIAISFHDTADVLDKILTEQPCIEAVQLQINYLDADDSIIQSSACYDVAVKHGKKVIVMEPVKGGRLVNLPDEAAAVLDRLGGGSYASYALRYVAEHSEVFMILSGMGNMDMIRDNMKCINESAPLSEKEREALDRVREIIRRVNQIPCTNCKYCIEDCVGNINIPEIFAVYNELIAAKITLEDAKEMLISKGLSASGCKKCGKCEEKCPQSIKIKEKLTQLDEILN